jgi:hypothetical protein
MDASELRQHRRNFVWTTALLDDIALLVVQYVLYASAGDPISAALAAAGWRPLEQIGRVPDRLIIAGDHMEADWIRSGDPDTYEDLRGMDDWIGVAIARGEIVVACAPGLVDRCEDVGYVVFDGALTAVAPVIRSANRTD